MIQSTLDPFIQKSLRGKKNNNKMFQKNRFNGLIFLPHKRYLTTTLPSKYIHNCLFKKTIEICQQILYLREIFMNKIEILYNNVFLHEHKEEGLKRDN